MPIIDHKNQPPIQPGTARVEATAAASIGSDTNPVIPPPVTAKQVAEAIVNSGISEDKLTEQIEAVLAKKRAEAVAAKTPKEPDWSSLKETDIMRPDVYIPIIEHEVPDYMRIQLKDSEYEAVWANTDQRRLGELLAQGYELLRKEHLAPGFKPPLNFESDGSYIYADVIALRVHKRILYSKRKLALERSQNQLRKRGASERIKTKLTEIIEGDPGLEVAFRKASMSLYDTNAS